MELHRVNLFLFLFINQVFISLQSKEQVLLDMRASGSELGWLTLPYENGARTTPELYYISLILTAASIFSTGVVMVRGLWLTHRKLVTDPSRNNEQ